ncbi:hypothetical protein BKA62DRAFT_675667 [Auriculariales sp. MPI-PUGE-AT-0066]|nr:hypothetical protein BKA62DRAFT_675667 [Auriculariales sp. MPI-PUGE-AT-0066]
MAYNNNPNHFPYYASVEQHQAQQRALYAQQQQATGQQYSPRDMRAHDQDALRRLSAGTPAARMPSSAILRPSALPAAGFSSYGAFSPVPRSTTVPPGYGGGGGLPMSSLTLAPIRGSNVPMSPPTRNAPPNMRQPHLLPPTVSGTQNIPAPSTSSVSSSNLSKGHTNEKGQRSYEREGLHLRLSHVWKQYQRKHDLFRHVRDKHPGHQAPGY